MMTATAPEGYRPCVGLALFNHEGLVFVGRRANKSLKEHVAPGHEWQMPQGGIDKGEDPREAALRELREETGISADLCDVVAETPDWVRYDLPPELVGKIWKGRYGGQAQKWFLVRYRGTDDQVNIATDHPEFDAWQWMAPEEISGKIVPFKRAVYDSVFDAFREHLAKG